MAGKNTFRAKTFASSTFASGMYNGVGVNPPVTIFPTLFLTGNGQRNVGVGGSAQRSVMPTGNAQRNVGLTGDAEVGS